MIYPNLKDNKIFGYGLNQKISKHKFQKSFTDYETKKLTSYKVDNDQFLKSLYGYDNQKYVFKIFGGSTSFCTEVNQEDSFFEKSFLKTYLKKNFYYKNYSIVGHDILHDFFKLKNFANISYPNSESIFFLNYGWNEEFVNSIDPKTINNNRPLNST